MPQPGAVNSTPQTIAAIALRLFRVVAAFRARSLFMSVLDELRPCGILPSDCEWRSISHVSVELVPVEPVVCVGYRLDDCSQS